MADETSVRRRLLEVQELERRRIASALHANPLQVLIAAALRVDVAAQAIDNPGATARLDTARVAVHDAVEQLRALLFVLHPPSLDRGGLAVALREIVAQAFEHATVHTSVDVSVEPEPAPGTRGALFQMAREAIANTYHHANATSVQLVARQRDGGVHVRVTDDGNGLASPLTADGLGPATGGLGFATELAQSAGGWLTVESTPGTGTTVEFWVPD
jgi:signal transduction histidine kinase